MAIKKDRRYRVVRSVLPVNSDTGRPYEGTQWENEIIWRGHCPSNYKGALGSFDCGEYYATRHLEVFNTSTGEWEEVK